MEMPVKRFGVLSQQEVRCLHAWSEWVIDNMRGCAPLWLVLEWLQRHWVRPAEAHPIPALSEPPDSPPTCPWAGSAAGAGPDLCAAQWAQLLAPWKL